MRLALAALVAGAGCAQIAGIDETTGPDTSSELATIQIQRVAIGASVVKMPADLSGQSATFYDDATGTLSPTPGVASGMDAFTADIPGIPEALVTLPAAETAAPRRLYALPSRVQKATYNVLTDPGAQPPPANAAVDLDITLPTPYVTGETFRVDAIGPWTEADVTELPAPDTGVTSLNPAPIPYAGFASTVGRDPTMITQADVVLVLRYFQAHLTGVFTAQFDQTDGADLVQGDLKAVSPTETLTAAIAPSDYQSRFSAVRPAIGTEVIRWRVTAAPGHSVADTNGVQLASGSADPAADTMISTMYGNPFESLDWRAVAVVTVSASRPYTYTENAMSANVNLSASLSSAGEASSTTDITMPAGLAITITANGSPLVTDGQTLALDTTQPVTLDATFDKTANTLYAVSIMELGLDVSGAAPVVTRTHVLDAYTAGTTELRVPADVLTVGKSYYLQYRSYVGAFSAAMTGDLTAVSLPYTTAAVESAVFTVGMP